MKHETTVLPDAVISPEARNVALIHVDVVHALSGLEVKVFVLRFFGSPFLPKRIDGGIWIRNAEANRVVHHFTQIVICARLVRRECLHVGSLYHSATNEILSQAAADALERG